MVCNSEVCSIAKNLKSFLIVIAVMLGLGCDAEDHADRPPTEPAAVPSATNERVSQWLAQATSAYDAVDTPDAAVTASYASALTYGRDFDRLAALLDSTDEASRTKLKEIAASAMVLLGEVDRAASLLNVESIAERPEVLERAARDDTFWGGRGEGALALVQRFDEPALIDYGVIAATGCRRWDVAEKLIEKLPDVEQRERAKTNLAFARMIETPDADWPELDDYQAKTGNYAMAAARCGGDVAFVKRAIELADADKRYVAAMKAVSEAGFAGHDALAQQLWDAYSVNRPPIDEMDNNQRGFTAFAASVVNQPQIAEQMIEATEISLEEKIRCYAQANLQEQVFSSMEQGVEIRRLGRTIRFLVKLESFDLIDQMIERCEPADRVILLGIAIEQSVLEAPVVDPAGDAEQP